ncbi:TlpA family protein disulfide reductase [Chloroflexota bacterium]
MSRIAASRDGMVVAAGLLLLAVVLAGCGGAQSALTEGVNEGTRARDFTLENLGGDEVSLSDFDGQVVLINFWATWCAPCRAEIPGIEEVYRARKDEGFVVLGVNVSETREQVEPFLASMDVTYPVLLDVNGEVTGEYRALGLPMSLLVTREGVIHTRHVGFLSDDTLESHLKKIMAGK